MGTRTYETLDLPTTVSGSEQLTPVIRSLAEWRAAVGEAHEPVNVVDFSAAVIVDALAIAPAGAISTDGAELGGHRSADVIPGRIPLGQRKLSLRSSVAKSIPAEMRIPLRGR